MGVFAKKTVLPGGRAVCRRWLDYEKYSPWALARCGFALPPAWHWHHDDLPRGDQICWGGGVFDKGGHELVGRAGDAFRAVLLGDFCCSEPNSLWPVDGDWGVDAGGGSGFDVCDGGWWGDGFPNGAAV
jgi:hypothetical protein